MILWEISDVTTTAVSPSAGSVMAPTTVVTARMRGTAVSVLLCIFQLSASQISKSCVSTRVTKFYFYFFFFSLVLVLLIVTSIY